MCGRYTLTTGRPQLEKRFGELASLPEDRIFSERFNIAPSQEIAAIIRPEGEAPRAELLRWGLVPSWSKTPETEVKMINARSETLLERPSYRGLARSSNGRCLVVADGFYEWQGVKGGPKQPWRFTVDGGEPFCFAGLHTTWVPEQGGLKLRSCTIITTTPNELVKPVHDRMPAILADPADLEAWLDPDLDGTEASGLLRPFDASRMSADRVARAVGKPGNEGPSLLIPEQEGLF